MASELDSLVSEYEQLRAKEGVTHLELVTLEHKIWNQLKLDHGTGLTKRPEVGERRDWFTTRFGGQTSTYDNRFTIYKAGQWAHILFDHVERGIMSLGKAKTIVGLAKKLTLKKKIPPAEALALVLADNAQDTDDDEDGIDIEEQQSLDPVPVGTLKSFHRHVSHLAAAHLEETFSGMNVAEYHRQTLIEDFNDSLDLLIREFGQKINKVKGDTRTASRRTVGAVKFNWACQVLGLKYRFDEDEVDLEVAKRRKNRRALELHPDRNPNNPKAAEELDRVIEAYEILETYCSRKTRSSRHG